MPLSLRLDEHFLSRKQGFATTFCNLKKHKIYGVVKGKSEKRLSGYLSQLEGKEQVKIVCMDLSPTYRSIASKYFPNALILYDRNLGPEPLYPIWMTGCCCVTQKESLEK